MSVTRKHVISHLSQYSLFISCAPMPEQSNKLPAFNLMFPRLYGYELSFVSFLVLAEYSDEDPEIVRAKFFFRDEFLVSFCIALFQSISCIFSILLSSRQLLGFLLGRNCSIWTNARFF